ncbi:putative lipid II flippase FtsW [Allostreptomyces psammosilenae]|uniref:Probable peptidoglycan glycosyltransferase FtsW n=1 Tax=Allostreptomyces psammosilenae TaxID=1892865 RepID=A0A853A0W6_9ACTN|nr:putative lipid II flippase FtsW [Allostreptomyces psammosilenae]NYI07100.1 cell division protein FtsW [Allostreptomyces psammosilenae]
MARAEAPTPPGRPPRTGSAGAAPAAGAARPARPARAAAGESDRAPAWYRRGRRALRRTRRTLGRPLTPYYLILGATALLLVLGLVMVFSASQIEAYDNGLPLQYYFTRQLFGVGLGLALLLVALRLPVTAHRAIAYPLLLVALGLLALVFVPGIGLTVNGQRNWIQFGGPFQFQPSEFAKLALVVWGADLLARKERLGTLAQWRHLFVPLLPVGMVLMVPVMLGGDMGTTMIMVAILFALLWLSGAPMRLFAVVLTAAGLLGWYFFNAESHRVDRLACVGNPSDADGCQQAVHGMYALATGGISGSGLGASVEKWGQLPEPHTDFILAVIGEELGLAGTLSVLVLYTAIGYAGLRVALGTRDPFVRYTCGAVVIWIMSQATVNIGSVLALLPIVGVPLPLVSYGGSAMLPTMFALGLLLACARGEPAARRALAARGPGLLGKTVARLRPRKRKR